MNRFQKGLWAVGAAGFLLLAACMSSPDRTHRADVLDDKVTSERVKAALNRAGKEFRNVEVEATSNTVRLKGTVGSADARTRAEHIARGVQGVSVVQDDLQVGR